MPCNNNWCFIEYQKKLYPGDNIKFYTKDGKDYITATGELDPDKFYNKQQIDEKLSLKQDLLSPGKHINIGFIDGVLTISATGDLDPSKYYEKKEIDEMFYKKSQVDEQISKKQDILKGSEYISLEDNIISLIGIDLSLYYKKTEIDSIIGKYSTTETITHLLSGKQDKLIVGDNITIDNNNKISASHPSPQFTSVEVSRLKALLAKTAFGVNKFTSNLEQRGFFTEQTFYVDLDKPNDNMVTDEKGESLPIRKQFFVHYSGTGMYKDNGSDLMVRSYRDQFTYNNKEVATVESAPISGWNKK